MLVFRDNFVSYFLKKYKIFSKKQADNFKAKNSKELLEGLNINI